MPGWAGSDRQYTLPADWDRTVARIRRRDGNRCQWIREDTERKCGRRADGGVDHKIRPADGGTDHDSNLWALCHFHHARKTGQEGGTASGAARRAKRDAAKPLHPGLLSERPRVEPPAPF
jgi:5-methylcytosine-specific restriction protein A